ncbi:mannitol-1-phosphate 5-dehydrogenase [Alkalihalobacillus pseudalcaliphilus]|uniref:mannitol-1-phosphate 5-dehydrogenase n=1 Tax=Alkalihalobacillus pseudalcaliphilus TaxID=79884 RepID=UPI00064D8F1C|nr:mannitol-1-phosphate 5-dehydrogenase [Alkalihalobacillus pseudalcaliphilus]KMK78044.1 mannitol-1-phosphate 5-dehydrogenase [Alkalihalobacillus pseudalcaliphilus]
MKAIHFGAGNIGRGFIGALLSNSGYEVVFVDVNETIIQEINNKKQYTVKMAEENGSEELITNIRALNSQSELEQVIEEIASADIVTTAIGPSILKFVAEPIAKGLQKKGNKESLVIACENAIGATETLQSFIQSYVDEDKWQEIVSTTSFPNSAVDRIVPNQHQEQLLTVAVEPFFEWAIDRSAIHTEVPHLDGATFVTDLTPYIERKLFTVNTGHATVAYIGYQKGYETIKESIQDPDILHALQETLKETSKVLTAQYGFDEAEHRHYVEKIIGRFENPHLSDEVTRVARGPLRKLSFNERFIKPARMLLELGKKPEALLEGIQAAFQFDVPSDPESVELQQKLKNNALHDVILEVTGLPESNLLVALIEEKIK